MTNRELDAAIAEALIGKPVVWVPAEFWGEGDGMHADPTATEKHPGWVEHCLCDSIRQRNEDLLPRLVQEYGWSEDSITEIREKWAANFLDAGHHWQCYEIAPFYSTDPVAADALMRALRERGFGVTIEIDVRQTVAGAILLDGGKIVARSFDGTWTEALAKAALSALTAGKP